jgi:hypothetical protein
MWTRIGQGIELAVRSGVKPLAVGLRWGASRNEAASAEAPSPRWDLALGSKVVLDEFVVATELLSTRFPSSREHKRVAREVSRALSLYEARNWLAHPQRYHRTPPSIERFQIRKVGWPWRFWHLSFESGYEPHPGEPGRTRWASYEANQRAHAWLLGHPDGPRPWLVCIPGYRMGSPIVDLTSFNARWLHEALGLNIAIPVLPFHGPRRVGRRSGDGFLTGDFVDTLHAEAQAVWDVRRLIDWLRARKAPALGIHGISLGGYTAALVAALDADLDCVIAGIPATDFVRLLRSHVAPLLLNALQKSGFNLERIEQLLHVISPLKLPPRVPHESRFLYAGLADSVASAGHARDLWSHWERPRAVWYRGTHMSFSWEAEVKELILEALTASGLVSPRLQL